MQSGRNYYEILGLPKDASIADIKRRYRQLARKYHPDVAKDKTAAAKVFVQITEAYKTLVDPEKRWAYDATLAEPAPARPQPASSRPAGTARPAGHSQSSHTAVQKLIKDAEMAFIKRRLNEAKGLCKEALRLDRSCARAHAILGDIYRVQKRYDLAINEYNYAVQLQPGDMDSQKKLEKLLDHMSPVKSTWDEPDSKLTAQAIALNTIGWSIAVFLLFMINIYPGQPIIQLEFYRLTWIKAWSWNLVGIMFVEGLLVGFLLGINGLVEHPDDELIFEGTGKTWAIIPTGILLLVFGPIFFLGSAGVYLLFGFLQGTMSKTVLKVFLATGLIVFFSAMLYPKGANSVLLFGGNIVFTGMLFGWYVGSIFRPER